MTLAQIFTAFYWFWIASELLLQLLARTSRNRGAIRDRGSLLALLVVIFLSVSMALNYPGARAHLLPGPRIAIQSIALLLMFSGFVLRWTAIVMLRRWFSTNVAIRSDQTLHTSGLYRWVRHPSYAGMLLVFLGFGLYLRNWVSLLIMLVFPTMALLYRIHVEEIALMGAFGEQYADYRRTARRLIPGIY